LAGILWRTGQANRAEPELRAALHIDPMTHRLTISSAAYWLARDIRPSHSSLSKKPRSSVRIMLPFSTTTRWNCPMSAGSMTRVRLSRQPSAPIQICLRHTPS
jgi:hypothetical protein